MVIQPQLVLLQKTLLNVEGLGRELDPDLDLWKTAKPFLEKWVSRQMGWRGLLDNLSREAPQWSAIFPKLPVLIYKSLQNERNQDRENNTAQLLILRQDRLLRAVVISTLFSVISFVSVLYLYFYH